MQKKGYTYIITNENNNIFYIGVTSNLPQRIYQHKEKFVDSFSKKHNLSKLVFFEIFDDMIEAIKREKQLKNWHRQWKINLINEFNPKWKDLYNNII